jgi:hypothetical protein
VDDPALDERLRRLQRIAYGAVASSAERAAALAELDALRRAAAAADDEDDAASGPLEPAPVHEKTPTGSTRATSEWIAASDAASVRRFRWAVTAGTAALLVGIAVGWQLGVRAAAPDAGVTEQALGAASSIGDTQPSAGMPVPVAGSAALAVFDRAAQPTDTPPVDPGEWVDASTTRLLAIAEDGVAVYGAKAPASGGSGDVCIVLVHPGVEAGGSCTTSGVFPDGCVRTDVVVGDRRYSATWRADGSVEVMATAA